MNVYITQSEKEIKSDEKYNKLYLSLSLRTTLALTPPVRRAK